MKRFNEPESFSEIKREGSFLYQLDQNHSGVNVWSGILQPNNGYSVKYAEQAAELFARAPEMADQIAKLKAANAELVEALESAQKTIETGRKYFPKSIRNSD